MAVQPKPLPLQVPKPFFNPHPPPVGRLPSKRARIGQIPGLPTPRVHQEGDLYLLPTVSEKADLLPQGVDHTPVALLQGKALPPSGFHLPVLPQADEEAHAPPLELSHQGDPVKAAVQEEEGGISQVLDGAAQAVEELLLHPVLTGERGEGVKSEGHHQGPSLEGKGGHQGLVPAVLREGPVHDEGEGAVFGETTGEEGEEGFGEGPGVLQGGVMEEAPEAIEAALGQGGEGGGRSPEGE